MSNTLISINNLSKKYSSSKEYSLKDVSLTISQGDKFGIFGPNGAGKTTLISIVCGILSYNAGSISYFNNDNKISFKKIKKRIGFIPQDLALYNELSAYQNIEYFGALNNMNKSQIQKQSAVLFDILGLNNVATKKVKTFSGGMKRRLNLAIGMIHNPELLFLDEPTVGIDIQSKNAIIDFLNSLNKNGITIVYTSHHLEEAEKLCTKIAVLDYGQLIANDDTNKLLVSHQVDNLSQLLIKLTGKEFRDNV